MRVNLDIFEGPLDLLLYLIKKNHLNITDIEISVVVDQYLHYLELMKLLDINVASEYLVMAATLVSIKSKMLLPQEEKEEEEPEEDPREELVQKLIEYEKFKEAADFLKIKERDRLKYRSRQSTGEQKKEVYVEASIFDLISAFRQALTEVPRDMFFEIIKDEYTVEEKMHDLLHTLVVKDTVALHTLFQKARNKLEIVVTFLAILELIKMREIVAVQKQQFGDIHIARKENVASSL
ncbi:MAG: hypothetical protein GF333_06330 [Candidatus Omnitrophica bacterium]|nr:hypothetical protein [Candidatus Omnitrophota bacterium]